MNKAESNFLHEIPPRKGRLLSNSAGQLDLFASLAARRAEDETTPAHAPAQKPPAPAPRPNEAPEEPEWNSPAGDPPEVAADVRALFLEEIDRQNEGDVVTPRHGKPPLITGIYRKPRPTESAPLVMPLTSPHRADEAPSHRPPATHPAAADRRRAAAPPRYSSTSSSGGLTGIFRHLWRACAEYFEGVELNRLGVGMVLLAVVLVALLAWWTAGKPEAALDPAQNEMASTETSSTPTTPTEDPPPPPAPPAQTAASGVAAPTPPPTPAPATPELIASDFAVAGAVVTSATDGGWNIRYEEAVFVSTDRISPAGMRALKATAARLLKCTGNLTITVFGHTDDIPLSSPTGAFRDNHELAAARAKTAIDHLKAFCKHAARFTFAQAEPGTQPAPYPNDSDAHRRMNRTITLRVEPKPAAAAPTP